MPDFQTLNFIHLVNDCYIKETTLVFSPQNRINSVFPSNSGYTNETCKAMSVLYLIKYFIPAIDECYLIIFGCRQTSPRTSSIVQILFYFWSFEIIGDREMFMLRTIF